jgi:glucose-1-phosphate cytidylyltransferase
MVASIKDVNQSDLRINGGYFVFRKEIFEYMKDGEELLYEPFQRLVERRELLAFKYDGFWAAMDTFKDKQILDDIYARGRAPWQVWNRSEDSARTNEPAAAVGVSARPGKTATTLHQLRH